MVTLVFVATPIIENVGIRLWLWAARAGVGRENERINPRAKIVDIRRFIVAS
jgi:hypothetical protein